MANHRMTVPGWLNEEYMAMVLEKGLYTGSIKVSSIDVKPGSVVGDNYCCQIFRIKVDVETDNKNETIFVIGKLTPDSKFLDHMVEKVDVFAKEAQFFDYLSAKLGKYIKIADISPKSYHVDFDHKSIFMEDLKQSCYELQPRGKFLNLEQCLLTVEALATFHSASWKLVRDEPDIKEKYLSTFWDGEINEMSEKFVENMQDNLAKYLDNYGLSEKINNCLLDFANFFKKNVQVFKRKDTNLNVIVHGDAWMNNMLYLYKNNVPCDVKLIDFQIMYYGCFAQDLQYFLFSSALPEVITDHLETLLEAYYIKLKELAPEIPDLTMERIRKEFQSLYVMGCCMLISFRSFLVSDTPPDFENIMNGGKDEMGFNHPNFIADIKKMLPFLEKQGIFD